MKYGGSGAKHSLPIIKIYDNYITDNVLLGENK